MSYVLDASVCLAWVMPDEFDPRVDELLSEMDRPGVMSSAVFPYEVANGIVMADRRGRISGLGPGELLETALLIEVEIDRSAESVLADRILPIAINQGLTVYDTSYLELAERRGVPLATLDRRLARAASDLGIRLILEEPI